MSHAHSAHRAGPSRHRQPSPRPRRPRPPAWQTLLAAAAALAASLALVFMAPQALAAGSVEVKFVEPDQFSDIGRTAWERDQALASLTRHLRALAARLPDNQSLSLEVLDVDLAGEQNPLRFDGVRVLRGTVDWPRMTLRWTLQGAGAAPRSGEARLSDPGYFFDTLTLRDDSELPFEKRMIDRWFDDTFGKAASRGGARR